MLAQDLVLIFSHSESLPSPHIPVKLGELYRDARFGQIEHRIAPGEGFPPEVRAIPAVQGEKGRVRFRKDVGLEGISNATLQTPFTCQTMHQQLTRHP